MIKTRELTEIEVPCKNRLTGEETSFTVMAFDFGHAKKVLEWELDLRWIIGYNAW